MEKNYKELLHQISTFIFDVDGVLTTGDILITAEGEMLRSMNTKDGYALKYALQKGYKIAIISGGTNEGVRNRLKALGVYDIYLGAHHKMDAYEELLDLYNLSPSEILYMGDDIPDLPIMEQVAVAACPQDAVPEIKVAANYISHRDGGKGCVRDIVEQVLRLQGQWDHNVGAKND
jgi:3-deoxy-D-manno-octulosonate 8-phosphate phosphatase (KDO 8-P phosphatase)